MTARRVILTGYNETVTNLGRRRIVDHQGSFRPDSMCSRMRNSNRSWASMSADHEPHWRRSARKAQRGPHANKREVDVAPCFRPSMLDGSVDHPASKMLSTSRLVSGCTAFMARRPRPTPEMLQGIDALVYDIQDIGVRFYTYETTMAYAMEAAAKAHIPFYVLDRQTRSPACGGRSAARCRQRIVRRLLRRNPRTSRICRWENSHDVQRGAASRADLHVSRCTTGTGRLVRRYQPVWVNPSPNMRSLNAAMLIRGSACSNIRRTCRWAEHRCAVRAAWGRLHDGPQLAAYLNKQDIPGVRIYPTSFTPTESKFAGVKIEGLRFVSPSASASTQSASARNRRRPPSPVPRKIDYEANRRLIR